ncbi:protocadherin 1 [Echinococcus multilocularis]|uniref:Protocadherin 1 n=1 Tax=Echinococcus multilocularis TaxID=6211 RepID=A0A087W1P7_ECHMU|nr:protocadherin 1 [Echinococcus multilocularis]
MRSHAFVQFILAIIPLLVKTSKTPRDFLTVDIIEEQPVGSHVTDIAQELGLPVDKSSTSGAADTASYFKIVVANSAINGYFAISPTNGRISLKKHLDRDMLCQNERLCCESEDDRRSSPVQMPDGTYFRRTAKACKMSFRVVYHLSANGSTTHESRMAFCTVDVNIHDLNDCAPRFLLKDSYPTYGGHYHPEPNAILITIPENTEIDTCFDLPMAFDEDSVRFSIQGYQLEVSGKVDQALDGSIHDTFAIRLGSCDGGPNAIYGVANGVEIANLKPKLQLRRKLDREAIEEYNLNLVVSDGMNSGTPKPLYTKQTNLLPHSASLSITVIVGDVNDHAPEVEASVEIRLKEDTPVGTRVTQIFANDKDAGDNAKIRYEIRPLVSSQLSRFPFTIDSTTGVVSIVNPLDADSLPQEAHGLMEFLVISSDNGQDITFSSTTTVSVQIDDINDEAPIIKTIDLASRSNPPRPTVRENLPPGTLVAFVTVTDADSGVNGMFTCRVDNPNFGLESIGDKNAKEKELQLITKMALDRELAPMQPVTIICVDHAHPVAFAKTGFQRILVSITDDNDNDPVFPNDVIELSVYENSPPGELLYHLNATDADEMVSWISSLRTPLIYEIDPTGKAFFSLDPSSGNLYTKESFDREKQEIIEFGVVAFDHGTPQRSASAKVIVRILDRNDHAPEFDQKLYNVSVPESTSLGEVVLKVSAHDEDQGPSSEFSFHLEDLRGSAQKHFELDPLSGNLTIKSKLDRERESHYSFQIYSVDRGVPRQTAYCRVNIQVLDVNDNPPKFVYPTQMNHTIHFSSWNSPESPLLKLTATDKDTGVNAEKIFLIAEGNEKGIFQLDMQTGDLSLKPDLDPVKVAGHYNLKLEVRDDGTPSLSGFTYITVILDAARPPLSVPTLPPGQIKVEQTSLKEVKNIPKPDREVRDRQLPYADLRGRPTENYQDREEVEGFFKGDHTLILIICLSAIATMLVLILFIILAWMRRRSLLAAARRNNHHGTGPGMVSAQEQFKTLFVEGLPKGAHLIPSTGWGDGKLDDASTTATLMKQASPVYWLQTTVCSKGALDEKNIHLQAVKGNGSEFSDNAISPTMFHDLQQVNNCLYTTSPGRKVVYHNSTNGTTSVIACDDRDDAYLSVPSTSFPGGVTKYIVDFPISSVYQSLILPAHASEPEASPLPNLINPGVYRNVCNSLPGSTTKGSGEGKEEFLRKGSEHSIETRLRRCKTIDCEAALDGASDGKEIFPRLSKKSVEFAQGGAEECLLALPSDEELDKEAEDGKVEQPRLQQTGTFCHLPSSFV